MSDEYQTRSEKTGLNFFSTLKEAYDASCEDSTIWKISYHNNRWVLIIENGIKKWENRPFKIDIKDGIVSDETIETLTDEQFKLKACVN